MPSRSGLPEDIRDPQINRARLDLPLWLKGVIRIRSFDTQLIAESLDFVIG